MAWVTCCSPTPSNTALSRRRLLCSLPMALLPGAAYSNCLPWISQARLQPAYRGEELQGQAHVTLSDPIPDLDTAYGRKGMLFFSRLQSQLDLAARGDSRFQRAPRVFESHLLTGNRQAAAEWGTPNEVIVIGSFSYLWFAGEDTLVYDPYHDAEWQEANPDWTLSQLADRKGPICVNTGLAKALSAGHEVLFTAPEGYYVVQSV